MTKYILIKLLHRYILKCLCIIFLHFSSFLPFFYFFVNNEIMKHYLEHKIQTMTFIKSVNIISTYETYFSNNPAIYPFMIYIVTFYIYVPIFSHRILFRFSRLTHTFALAVDKINDVEAYIGSLLLHFLQVIQGHRVSFQD